MFWKNTFIPTRLNLQNTSLFVSLFRICKRFQCLKIKFVGILWSLNILHAMKLYNYEVCPLFFFACLITFFINFQNINLIIFNQVLTKCQYYKNKRTLASQKQPIYLPLVVCCILLNLSGYIPQCFCFVFVNVFFILKRVVVCLHSSPFYFSFLILAFLTLFSNMEKIISFTCFSISSLLLFHWTQNTAFIPTQLCLVFGQLLVVFLIKKWIIILSHMQKILGERNTESWHYYHYTS